MPWALAVGLAALPAVAQTSASYRLTESTIDAGGDPAEGTALTAPHFRVTLDALAVGVVGSGIASASFRLDAGFVGRFPPPGEVKGLVFADGDTLIWSAEPSAGGYEVYRDLVSTLPGSYGTCFASDLSTETATDPASPAPGQGYFYLVTVRNRLGEEGTKGSGAGGSERGNPAPCP